MIKSKKNILIYILVTEEKIFLTTSNTKIYYQKLELRSSIG